MSKVFVVLENALTLFDLRIGGALLLEDLIEECVVLLLVGVEVEDEDDGDWFPLREEDLKAATAITRKLRKMWEN